MDGRLQPNAEQDVQFSLSGPGVIAAVGNGDGQDPASYQGDQRKLYQGRALVVIRTSKQTGPITVTASSQDLTKAITAIQAQAVAPRAELH